MPDDELVLICTGSQGEQNAALTKIVDGHNKNLHLNKNDLVIFSSQKFQEMKKE